MSEKFSWDKVLGESNAGNEPAEEKADTETKNSEEVEDLLGEIKEPEERSSAPSAPPSAPPLQEASDKEKEELSPQPETKPGAVPSHLLAADGYQDPNAEPKDSNDEKEAEEELPTYDEFEEEFNPNKVAPVPKEVLNPEVFQERFRNEGGVEPDTTLISSEEAASLDQVHIDEILRLAVERKASDIHLTVGLPPMIRLDGEVIPLPYEIVTPEHSKRMVYDTLTTDDLERFEKTHELDFGYSVKGLSRFRFNAYMQRGAVAAALRIIPSRVPSFDELKLPGVIRDLSSRSSGLILVTGPTGSGKSTTIAAMIDDINSKRGGHILTIEDPIEYLHHHKRCMVNQRELHSDTYSFHSALRAVLREDPDIILVGELRDLETIEAALTLAETGHLVFGTLHTRNAPATIDRVVDVFPADQQEQIRVLLGNTIEGIISQQLLPKLGGGRTAALEIMTGIPAIKNLIREGKTHQMYSIIETNQKLGMVTMDKSLSDLLRLGLVSYDECLMRAVDKETFARLAKNVA
jgi:twitching motility protein PilT